MSEGQERSPPAGCTVAKHASGPAEAAAILLQPSLRILQKLRAAYLDLPAAVFRFQVPYHSLARVFSLAESLSASVAV